MSSVGGVCILNGIAPFPIMGKVYQQSRHLFQFSLEQRQGYNFCGNTSGRQDRGENRVAPGLYVNPKMKLEHIKFYPSTL